MDKFEESRAKARAFFNGVNPVGVSSFYAELKSTGAGNNRVWAVAGSVCYGNFIYQNRPTPEPFPGYSFASNCYTAESGNKHLEVADRYLNWLFSKEKSPLRSFFKEEPVEFLYNKDKIRVGFLLPTDMLMTMPWASVLSLGTFARQMYEHTDNVYTWDILVHKGGFTPEEAFVLCTTLLYNRQTQNFSVAWPANMNHWPISLDPNLFNFTRFSEANPNLKARSVFDVWSNREVSSNRSYYDLGIKYGDLLFNGDFGTIEKTQFSTIRRISFDDIRTHWEKVKKRFI